MKRPTFNEINITPLTDIFLVLLIIMMVIAPMLDQQGLKLSIPEYVEQNETDTDKESKILTVVVDENNNYYIGDIQIPAEKLSQEIKERTKVLSDGLKESEKVYFSGSYHTVFCGGLAMFKEYKTIK